MKERRQQIKDKTVNVWEDTGEKVIQNGRDMNQSETEEEYKLRQADDKKWGIKTD